MLDRTDMLERLPLATAVMEHAPGVLVAYVFGSILDPGRLTIRDVDFAVLAREPLTLEEIGALLLDLEKAMGTERIDIVDVGTARREVRFEALSRGRLLVERDRAAHVSLRERTLREHLAARYHVKLYLSALRRELYRSYAHAAR